MSDQASVTAEGPRKRGRRVGDTGDTRAIIVGAARDRFADDGFDATSMRSIARAAGVDPALLGHYFGSKQELFLAAHQIPEDAARLAGAAVAAPLEQRGEVLARIFLQRFLDDPRGVSLIRSAAADDAVARLLRDTIARALIDHADALTDGGEDAAERMALTSAVLVGVVFHRRILKIDALTSLDAEELARRIGPAIQALLQPSRTPGPH